jgi:hypothetical protein
VREFIVTDSVTTLGPDPRGRAALAASHGGLYAAYLAAKAELKAVILSDAGVGRERAGIAGLDLLEGLGMPAATIGHRSARIGDGKDSLARGMISFTNGRAQALGVKAGMTAQAAMDILAGVDIAPARAPSPMHETRHGIAEASAQQLNVIALDSNALVTPQDVGHIIVTGSHGGLLGGRPETAVKQDVFAALYNDADIGIDGAGASRLPALDARGIAGATVSAWSARIGDGQSTYNDGFVSALNERAARCGGEVGISAKELVARLVAARVKELKA